MKEFYTYEQQIQKLKEKGLIITDEASAIEFLKLEGYYNVINGYSPNFKNNGVSIKERHLRRFVISMLLTRS